MLINKNNKVYVWEKQKSNKFEWAWRKQWIQPYESPWSVFRKIMEVNQLKANDLLYLFGNEGIKNLVNPSNAGFYRRELVTMEHFCEHEINHYLGIDYKKMLKESNKKVIGAIQERFRDYAGYYYHSHFTFCSKCLEKGYHSILHQISLFDRCFLHDIVLKNCCPSCKRQYDYFLIDEGFITPFTCVCGYRFIKGETIKDLYKKWNYPISRKRIKNQLVKDWFAIEFDDYHIYTSNYLYDGTQHEHKKDRSLFLTHSLIKHYLNTHYGESNNISRHVSRKCLSSIRRTTGELVKIYKECYPFYIDDTDERILYKKIAFHPWGGKLYRYFYTEIFFDSIRIYKSIARFIRRRILNVYTRQSNDRKRIILRGDTKCKYAFAYHFWRYMVENLSVFYFNDTGFDYLIKDDLTIFFKPYPWTEEFRNIIIQFFRRSRLHDENLTYVKWIINHTLAHLLISLFSECLNVIQEEQSQDFYYIDRKVRYRLLEYVPDFTVLIPDDDRKAMYFYKPIMFQKIKKQLETF
ncbi:hypothetical protein [Anoxybacteroides tepidamans]|uniref:hypothetical protein n=1 Tax=Anoxybacteroides tepidamans TaxID=265948 RepID=UPI000481CB3A|nr:hypothetical protein [Anoxybacillus tepidamans]